MITIIFCALWIILWSIVGYTIAVSIHIRREMNRQLFEYMTRMGYIKDKDL